MVTKTKMSTPITAAQLCQVLHYVPAHGLFIWCKGHYRQGRVAGTISHLGYVRINIMGRLYHAHRLAWLWMTGDWPPGDLDHANCCKSDNSWDNLRRTVHRWQNNVNRPADARNKSGIKGVLRRGNRWYAQITRDGRQVWLGSFSSKEEAARARAEAAERMFGQFVCKSAP